jgi:nucleoside-diphosphate-sugar epimerase
LNPRYSYGGGKIISELLTLNYGLTFLERAIVFRPHNVYGPDMGREHVIPQIALRLLQSQTEARGAREFDFPIQGSGSETRSFLFIDDMVRGILTLLERGEHRSIYHIGNSSETTIRELVETVARELDLAPRIISGALRPGSVKRRCPDITKIRQLGYEPVVTLQEGLKRTLPWYQANP